MTTAQHKLAFETQQELKELAPAVDWRVTYNHYTKLPEFTAIKDGGVQFSMYKRERYENYRQVEKFVELSATYDNTTHDSTTGMIVSGAHAFDALPKAEVKAKLERVNFKKYIEFVKANLGMLERIGA